MLTKKFRPFALALGALVLIALVAITALRVHGKASLKRAAATFERDVHALDLTTFRRPEVPAVYNAAHWIQAGTEALALEKGDREFLLGIFRKPYEAFDIERARTILTTNRSALDLLHRATALEQASYHLDYEAGLDMEIPSLLPHIQAARLLLLELRVALDDQRWDDALVIHSTQRRLAEVLYEETPLIFQLIGLVAEKTAWTGVQSMLAADLDDPDTLRVLRQPIGTLTPGERFRRSMGGEGAIFYQLMDHPEELASSQDFDWWQEQQLKYLPDASRVQMLDGLRLLVANYAGHTALELSQDPAVNDPQVFGPMAKIAGNLMDVAYKFKHTEAIALLADQALALRLAAVTDGAYPATWPEVRSPYSGATFVYRREADGSAVLAAPAMVDTLKVLRPGSPEIALDRWELPGS